MQTDRTTDTHYKTASTQYGQFVVTEKSARRSNIGPITFIAPLPTSPVDVQTPEPTQVTFQLYLSR